MRATDFGERTEVFNGIDVTVNARLAGAQFGGGLSTGRTGDNDCVLIDTPQAIRSGYCNVDTPLSSNTQVKLNGSYVLPYRLPGERRLSEHPGDSDCRVLRGQQR